MENWRIFQDFKVEESHLDTTLRHAKSRSSTLPPNIILFRTRQKESHFPTIGQKKAKATCFYISLFTLFLKRRKPVTKAGPDSNSFLWKHLLAQSSDSSILRDFWSMELQGLIGGSGEMEDQRFCNYQKWRFLMFFFGKLKEAKGISTSI